MNALEQKIRGNRLLKVTAAWTDEIVFPYFDGLSLANVPQTVMDLLGVTVKTPLDNAIWSGQSFKGQIDRVVVFLTDGLGYLYLRQLLAEDPELCEIIADITDGRDFVPITSVAPSTTAVALPTMWTGVPPATHGMVGTFFFLREFAMLGNILHYKPAYGVHRSEEFADWGLEPEKFIPIPTVAERLAEVGVETHLLLPKELIKTGLSRLMHRGVQHLHMNGGYTDLWLRFEDILKDTVGKRCYINVYWPAVDTLSHGYGVHTRYLKHEIKSQFMNLRNLLNSDSIKDGRTLCIILADHGHYDVPHQLSLTDEDIKPMMQAIRAGIGAEGRFAYLYLRDGYKQQVIETIEDRFADCFTWIDGAAALNAGLFGCDDLYEETPFRLGDLILVPRIGYQLQSRASNFVAISRHGGLSEWEMLVPLLWKQI